MALISATFVICERALREADGVLSAIRIVDYFVAPPPEILAEVPLERQAVQMTILGGIRVTRDDDENHEIVLTLVRPNGEESPNVLATGQPIPVGRIPDIPRQVWVVAQIGVTPKQFGPHYFKISLDGAEIARVHFTLAQYSKDDPILKANQPRLTVP
jgi:hypothetical protein